MNTNKKLEKFLEDKPAIASKFKKKQEVKEEIDDLIDEYAKVNLTSKQLKDITKTFKDKK